MSKTRRELILESVEDLTMKLLNDDRKEDEELPRGAIEDALRNKEITFDEIADTFAVSFIENRSWKPGDLP